MVICIISIIAIIYIIAYIAIIQIICIAGWLKSVGIPIVYELDHRKLFFMSFPSRTSWRNVLLSQSVTQEHHLRIVRNVFPGAPGYRRPGAGDGCKMWFINSWALG
jgi:hypothetical protein